MLASKRAHSQEHRSIIPGGSQSKGNFSEVLLHKQAQSHNFHSSALLGKAGMEGGILLLVGFLAFGNLQHSLVAEGGAMAAMLT